MLNPMSTAGPVDRATLEQVRRSWPILLVSGLVSVVAGTLVLSIEWTVEDLALFVAILFIVRGVLQMTARTLDRGDRWWNLFAGACSVGVGVVFIALPEPSLLTAAIFIGAWVVVSGVFDVAGGVANRQQVKYWWVFVVAGILEVGIGIALLRRPGLTLAVAIVAVGIWAFVVGLLQVIAAFEVRNLPATAGGSSARAPRQAKAAKRSR